MSFQPPTYEEALERTQKRQIASRTRFSVGGSHLTTRNGLKRSRGLSSKQPIGQNRKAKPQKRSSAIPYATNSLKAKKRGKKTGRKKLPSIKNLRKRVWAQFSIFIRTRDADEFGVVSCCTCPARHHWNSGEIHAGHWIHGRLDFDERNIHGQCRNDNFYSHTKVNTAYACFMAKTYGAEVMDELRLLSNTTSNKLKRDELNELLEKYESLNAANPLLAKDR